MIGTDENCREKMENSLFCLPKEQAEKWIHEKWIIKWFFMGQIEEIDDVIKTTSLVYSNQNFLMIVYWTINHYINQVYQHQNQDRHQ